MLEKSKVFKTFEKWSEGLNTLNSNLNELESQKQILLSKINDDTTDQTPAEMVQLHTELHQVYGEIDSVKAVQKDFKERKLFKQHEFEREYRAIITKQNKSIEKSEKKMEDAYEALQLAIKDHKVIYNEYIIDLNIERVRWMNVAEKAGLDTHGRPAFSLLAFPVDVSEIYREVRR